jgi:hypothetical protein
MSTRPQLIEISISEYRAGQEPDYEAIGQKLDAVLIEHFKGKEVVIRCIGSQDHPSLSVDELAKIILKSGIDRYDPNRAGVGYEGFKQAGRHVDFYGEEVKIDDGLKFMGQQIWEMHHSAIGDRGFPVHVDLILIYDRSKVSMVMDLYDFHATSDGYVFKEPDEKGLLGQIKIE